MRPLGGVLLLALAAGANTLACNAFTEIGDFAFDEPGDASANAPVMQDAGGPPAACGVIGSDVPACQDCIETTCCDEARACGDDATCVANRDCLLLCRTSATDRDRAECVGRCVETNACGFDLWRNFTICRDTQCGSACAASTPPADTGPDRPADEPGMCEPPVTGPCNDVPQCGCSQGDNCIIMTPGGRTECVSAGTTANNMRCSVDENCRVGSSCVAGVCKASCHEPSDCAGGSSDGCYVYRARTEQCGPRSLVPFNVRGFCNVVCDPVDPSAACGPGLTCNPRVFLDCEVATGTGTGPSCAQGCAPGYDCVSYGDSDHDVCEKWCRYTPDQETCPVGFTCSRTPDAPDGYGLCARDCEPLGSPSGPRGCPAGSRCFALNDGFEVGYADCIPSSGTKPVGAACVGYFECSVGTVCEEGSCTPTCELAGAACPEGAACVGQVTLGGATFGYCKPR